MCICTASSARQTVHDPRIQRGTEISPVTIQEYSDGQKSRQSQSKNAEMDRNLTGRDPTIRDGQNSQQLRPEIVMEIEISLVAIQEYGDGQESHRLRPRNREMDRNPSPNENPRRPWRLRSGRGKEEPRKKEANEKTDFLLPPADTKNSLSEVYSL